MLRQQLTAGPAQSETFRPDRASDLLAFSALGTVSRRSDAAGRETLSLRLPATALPAGTRVTGVRIDLALAGTQAGPQPIVSVTMNGLLLGTAVARADGPTHLRLSVPETAQSVDSSLAVTLTRRGDPAGMAFGAHADFLPSSAFVLGAAGTVADFYQLAPLYKSGVTVVLPDTSPSMLSGTARILRGLVDASDRLDVAVGNPPTRGPVVWVSTAPPPGSDPAIRFDSGRVRLVTAVGEILVGAKALRTRTVVQLLKNGAEPILWIRPGRAYGAARNAPTQDPLSRGDVAIVDGGRLQFAFTHGANAFVDIDYLDRIGLAERLKQYRLWMIAAVWLIFSLGFLYLLRGVTQARAAQR